MLRRSRVREPFQPANEFRKSMQFRQIVHSSIKGFGWKMKRLAPSLWCLIGRLLKADLCERMSRLTAIAKFEEGGKEGMKVIEGLGALSVDSRE